MSYNDLIVISADVANKAALAALGANIAGFSLPPVVSLMLIVLAASTGTVLTHLEPVGSRRVRAA